MFGSNVDIEWIGVIGDIGLQLNVGDVVGVITRLGCVINGSEVMQVNFDWPLFGGGGFDFLLISVLSEFRLDED